MKRKLDRCSKCYKEKPDNELMYITSYEESLSMGDSITHYIYLCNECVLERVESIKFTLRAKLRGRKFAKKKNT